MAKHLIDNKIITTAKRFKQSLIKNHIQVDKLIIFGSQIKGNAKSWSDIDIGVVSPDLSGLHLDDFPRLRRISEPISLDIEPHGLTPSQFNSPEHGLAHEMKQHGISI
jgi:predicted nucleotidyltransferase